MCSGFGIHVRIAKRENREGASSLPARLPCWPSTLSEPRLFHRHHGRGPRQVRQCPEKLFEGKKVCVTGLIESYDHKPLIVVKEKAQIRLVD